MARKAGNATLATGAVIGAGMLWGTMGLFVHYFASLGLTSLTISGIRAVVSAGLLLLIAGLTDRRALRVRWRDLWCFFGTGVCSVLFFNFCYFCTIQASSMAVAATLLYTAPVFVTVLSVWLFGEKVTGRKLGALILAISGCVLVSGVLSDRSLTGKGLLLGIGAGVGYALYSIFSRFALQRGYSSLTVSVYTFVFAALGAIPLTDFGAITGAFSTAGIGLAGMLVLYAAVTTVAPYLLYTFGLTGVENSKASVIASVEPVTAAILGACVYREIPSLTTAIGMVLVLAAVVILGMKETAPVGSD